MMTLPKNRSLIFFCFLILNAGCTRPSFKILNQDEGRTELLVTPDRILLECENVQDPTEPLARDGRYGLMIHVLDEENTVTTASQGNVLGKRDCFERIKEIGKIVNNGKQIYIGGMGNLKDSRKKNTEYTYIFPGNRKFYSNSRALQFMVIMNEKKECFSAHEGKNKPCPRDEFPIISK